MLDRRLCWLCKLFNRWPAVHFLFGGVIQNIAVLCRTRHQIPWRQRLLAKLTLLQNVVKLVFNAMHSFYHFLLYWLGERHFRSRFLAVVGIFLDLLLLVVMCSLVFLLRKLRLLRLFLFNLLKTSFQHFLINPGSRLFNLTAT